VVDKAGGAAKTLFMDKKFAHLHLHTQYSLLDGAILLKDLFRVLPERGMDTVAITDHGNMYGAVDFFKRAKAVGIKPIFGCEVYVAEKDMTDRSQRSNFHLILLARNAQGFANLRYLVSMGHLKGFYYHPRIDRNILKGHAAGLIGLSACMSGQIPKTLLDQGWQPALEVARSYKEIFEPGMFYLELQSNGLEVQKQINEDLVRMGAKLDLPVVATNDCHYLDQKHSLAQEVLMCIQQGRTLEDEKRIRHDTDQLYLKSAQEMEKAFAHVPQALENVAKITAQCHVELELDKTYLPQFRPPERYSLEDYLRHLAREGLKQRFEEIRKRGGKPEPAVYEERLASELEIIISLDFAGYFLIVWDFIRYAKDQSIPVGPGRGSGAGSLVAYSLRITDIDPIEHGLLFERFLNPERLSMPDFDIDFCMNRRDEVLKYVVEKYGRDNVGQIVTYSTLKARGVVRDVARVMNIPYSEADAIAKLVPEGPAVTLSGAMESEKRLQQAAAENESTQKILDLACSLEGLHRHAGMHAAGIVISEQPLWDYVPVARAQEGQVVQAVSQYAKDEVEQVGLVKFDFLGLKTLTIIQETLVRVNVTRRLEGKAPLRMEEIPTDDAPVFAMLQRGETGGVFQMESEGFAELVKKLKPDRFSDLVAAVALYRPGPLQGGMVDDFIARKHGRQKVRYPHPALSEILGETYGVMVYQEQVMQCASIMGGFSLGGADILRRAMGKKKVDLLKGLRDKFVEGAVAKEIDARKANEVFDLMEQFAGYGFNKSHSACYALLAYQTAFLKCHYPVEYMAGILTCEKENSDNVVKYMGVAREMDIAILPPDINESGVDFSVVRTADGKKAIRFGLAAVKRVGIAAVESIITAREESPLESLYDVTNRVDLKKANRGVLESLIKAGAMDNLPENRDHHRAQLLATLDRAIELGQKAQRDRAAGQTSLFGRLDAAQQRSLDSQEYKDVARWTLIQKLAHEKESLGFYISGHPLQRYIKDVKRFASHSTTNLGDIKNGRKPVSVAGVVEGYRERSTKSGSGRIAYFALADLNGKVDVIVFPRDYEKASEILPTDEPILVKGQIRKDDRDGQPKIHLREIMLMKDLRLEKTTVMELALESSQITRQRLEKLRSVLREHPGTCTVAVRVRQPEQWEAHLDLPDEYKVNPSDELVSRAEHLFGENVCTLS
jgi:DNA polymerase-3 subunit alpha